MDGALRARCIAGRADRHLRGAGHIVAGCSTWTGSVAASNFGIDPRTPCWWKQTWPWGATAATKARGAEAHDRCMGTIPGVKIGGAGGFAATAHGMVVHHRIFRPNHGPEGSKCGGQANVLQRIPGIFPSSGHALLSGEVSPGMTIRNASPRWHGQPNLRARFRLPRECDGPLLQAAQWNAHQVVGIVEDGKYTANIAEELHPAMFLPILQSPSSETWLVVRSSRDPQQLAAAIRARLRDLDAGLPSLHPDVG